MNAPLPELCPIASIVRRARMHRYGALGPDYESLPVPVHSPNGLVIVRMLSATTVDEDTNQRFVKPPSYIVSMRADTGEFAEVRARSPADFNLKDPPGESLGQLVLPEDFAARAGRLFTLLDSVTPAFAAGQGAPLAPISRAAAETRTAFFDIAETPLIPYYQSLGKRFFEFLDRAAKAR